MFSSTCLLVSRITPKLLNRFSKTSVERWHIGHGRNSEILVVIRIWMQEFFFTTVGHDYIPHGRAMFNEFNRLRRDCRELPVSGCKSYDIHMSG